MDRRDETSIWKKEITFRRKAKPASDRKAKPASDHPAPPKPPETSIWKKEITLRRKPKKGPGYIVLPPTGPGAKSESESAVESLRSRPRPSYDLVVPPVLPPVSVPLAPPVSAPPTASAGPPLRTFERPDGAAS